jgi:TusA-related sulfurtransferase
MITIDTRGKVCPEPLIMTKRSLSDAPKGSSFEILGNNAVVRLNVSTYIKLLGFAPEIVDEEEGEFKILFNN